MAWLKVNATIQGQNVGSLMSLSPDMKARYGKVCVSRVYNIVTLNVFLLIEKIAKKGVGK